MVDKISKISDKSWFSFSIVTVIVGAAIFVTTNVTALQSSDTQQTKDIAVLRESDKTTNELLGQLLLAVGGLKTEVSGQGEDMAEVKELINQYIISSQGGN